MAMSAEHTRSKFAALHRQWWRLRMSEKFSIGTINFKQTNKISPRVLVSCLSVELTRGPWATSLTWKISSYDYVLTWLREKKHYYFIRISWFFIWTNLNHINPGMLCAKSDCIKPSGSGKENSQNSLMFFHHFSIIFCLKKVEVLFHKIKPLHSTLRPVSCLIEISLVFLEKNTKIVKSLRGRQRQTKDKTHLII